MFKNPQHVVVEWGGWWDPAANVEEGGGGSTKNNWAESLQNKNDAGDEIDSGPDLDFCFFDMTSRQLDYYATHGLWHYDQYDSFYNTNKDNDILESL